MKQAALTVALLVGLVAATLLTQKPRAVATLSAAQNPPSRAFGPRPRPAAARPNRMLGENWPVLSDTNGNGRPDGSDAPVDAKISSGNTITISSPWSCKSGGGAETITLQNPDAFGTYQGGTRTVSGLTQTVTRSSPSLYSFVETYGGGVTATGTLQLSDSNGDGFLDTITVSGGNQGTPVSFGLSLVGVDVDGDGHADYLSIPWSQASLAGIPGSPSCGGNVAQIWIPLADSDGDGIPDSIVVDLNGDGIPDIQFPPGPRLGPVGIPVPTLNVSGQLLMLAGLTGVALWSLRRRSGLIGTP